MSEILYLGHIISNDKSDTIFESIVRDYDSEFNIFMADFGCTK